jgi:hypothetical protein
MSLKKNFPFIPGNIPGEDLDKRGFSRSIRTDKSVYLSGVYGQIHIYKSLYPAKAFTESCYSKQWKAAAGIFYIHGIRFPLKSKASLSKSDILKKPPVYRIYLSGVEKQASLNTAV